jgi:hypothetical protein
VKKIPNVVNWLRLLRRDPTRDALASSITGLGPEIPGGLGPDIWKRIEPIEGWLQFPAADFSWRLIRAQHARAVGGCILEIGVHKGRYLALLAAAARGTGKAIFGIDGFFSAYHVEMEERWVPSARQTMIDNVNRVAPGKGRLEIIKRNTNDLSPRDLRQLLGDRISFASVDGGHDAHDVYNDMRIVAPLLADGGVIAADDVFNPIVPGVAEGVCRFLESRKGRKLAAFATCGNKLYITSVDWHAVYLALSKAILANGQQPYLERARRRNAEARAIGFAPNFFGREIVPFA